MRWSEKLVKAAQLDLQASRLHLEASQERCPVVTEQGRCTDQATPEHEHHYEDGLQHLGRAWGVR